MFIYFFNHSDHKSSTLMARLTLHMQDFDTGYVPRHATDNKSKIGTYLFLGAAFILFVSFLIANDFLTVFLIGSAFAAANAVLRMYKAYTEFPLELELTIFATVIMTMGFGLKAGIFVAIWCGFWGDVFTGVTAYTPITVGSYVLAAVLASFFPQTMFTTAGIIISAIVSALSWVLYHFTESFEPYENIGYALTDFAGNLYFFVALAWIAGLII
jgi:hypothetical protein